MARDTKDIGSKISAYADAFTAFSFAQGLAFCFALGSHDFSASIMKASWSIPVLIVAALLLYTFLLYKCHEAEDVLLGKLTPTEAADKAVRKIRKWRFCLVFLGGFASLAAVWATHHGSEVQIPNGKTASTSPVSKKSSSFPTPGDYFMTTGGKCADLGSDHASATHANVLWGPCNDTPFQRWTIQPDPSRPNRFLIEWFSNSGKFWAQQDFSEDTDHLAFGPRRDSAFQSWNFFSQANGSYHITNDGSGKCVDFNIVPGGREIRLLSCGPGGNNEIVLQPAQ